MSGKIKTVVRKAAWATTVAPVSLLLGRVNSAGKRNLSAWRMVTQMLSENLAEPWALLRHKAWMRIKGAPETDNATPVHVDPEALRQVKQAIAVLVAILLPYNLMLAKALKESDSIVLLTGLAFFDAGLFLQLLRFIRIYKKGKQINDPKKTRR